MGDDLKRKVKVNKLKINDKIVLVTGATGQLGTQFCKTLSREGVVVYVSDLDYSDQP